MKKRISTWLACTLLFCGGLAAQNTAPHPMLKGKVVDQGGETVIGAHVKWKGDKTGAVTDLDGMFSIPEKGTELVISFLGYKTQTIKVRPGQRDLVIRLEDDAQDLDEIVVIGYGTQKKAALTSSIETIKREDLLSMPTANLDEALYGQVAGLQVMQTTGDPSTAKESDLHIRGINNAPLLVIDGVPRFGTTTSDGEMRLSDLNPDDIESISILKDAAAAAVYGSRAANGVILVQTKRAEGNQKVSVNYRGQMNIQQAAQLPDFLNAYEYAKLYNRAVEKGLTPDQAPFRHIYTGIDKTVKRAIPSQVISRIKALDLSAHTLLEQARDLFLFSFYTRGMSFVDMAYLKKKDLQNGLLVYRRQKTAQQLFIKWEAPMQEIVNRYWDAKSPYLLPIITSPGQQERRQYLRAIHTLNEHLKEIGKMVNSPVPLTSYVARHGWANIARSRNVPIAVISEAMGHDSESTTRIYLASLDSSLVDQANSQIIHSI